jgi:hypothetical protein
MRLPEALNQLAKATARAILNHEPSAEPRNQRSRTELVGAIPSSSESADDLPAWVKDDDGVLSATHPNHDVTIWLKLAAVDADEVDRIPIQGPARNEKVRGTRKLPLLCL